MLRPGRLLPVPFLHCSDLGIRYFVIIVGAPIQELGVDCGKVGDSLSLLAHWCVIVTHRSLSEFAFAGT